MINIFTACDDIVHISQSIIELKLFYTIISGNQCHDS